MMSVNELLVISVKLTRKMSKFSQLNGLIFQFSCVVFPDFPTSLSPYHPKSLTYSSLKQPWGYWGVENKVHYVRDVTQGEDSSRIRTTPLVGLFVQARNLALNLYRESGWTNMAQAQRRCSQSLDLLMDVFRMK